MDILDLYYGINQQFKKEGEPDLAFDEFLKALDGLKDKGLVKLIDKEVFMTCPPIDYAECFFNLQNGGKPWPTRQPDRRRITAG